jgi:lipoprotein-releasing system permease protein
MLVKGFLWGTSIGTGKPLFALEIGYNNIMIIALITTVASTLAAFIPAQKSSKLNPVEVIRNG